MQKKNKSSPQVKDLIKFFTTGVSREDSVESPPCSPGNPSFEHNVFQSQESFFGREEEIVELHGKIKRNKRSGQNLTVVSQSDDGAELSSGGGVGKTEFVRKYLQEYKNRYEKIFWIDATDGSSMRKDFRAIASKLGLLEENGEFSGPEVTARVYDSIRDCSKCLLILDNVESLDISEFLPPEDQSGKPMVLIITSKHWNWSQEPILLPPWDSSEGAKFLQKELNLKNVGDLESISKLADGLPSVLQMILPLIDSENLEDEDSTVLAEFLRTFQEELDSYLEKPPLGATGNLTLKVLFQMSVQQIKDQDEPNASLAFACLKRLVFLPAIVHKQVLRALFPQEEPEDLGKAVELLADYKFVVDLGTHIEISTEIQEFAGDIFMNSPTRPEDVESNPEDPLVNSERNQILEEILECFKGALLSPGLDQDLLQEHLQSAFKVAKLIEIDFSRAGKLDYCHLVPSALASFDFIESYKLFETILNFRIETIPEPEDPASGKKLETGKQYLKSILQGSGSAAPEQLASKQILAYVYNIQGKYEKALSVFKEVAVVQKKYWGPTHNDYLVTKNTIGTLFVEQNECDQALEIYSEIYQIFKQNFGEEHPFSVTVLNNIAVVYHRLGDYPEALETYDRVLEIQEKILPANDSALLRTKNNIAVIFEIQGEYSRALEIFLDVFQAQMEVLGPNHPDTLTSGHNIASILDIQENYEEALQIYEDIHEGRCSLLGRDHPDTLSTSHNMALLLDKHERYPEAISIYKQVYSSRREVLGEDHPDTLNTLYNMAIALENDQQLDQALEVYSSVQSTLSQLFGPDHPAAFYVLQNMALVLEKEESYDQAYELYQQIYESQRRTFGAQHPDTLHTRQDMASLLEHRQLSKEAFDMYSDVYESRKQLLGEEHPDTLTTLQSMASILSHQENYSESSRIYSQLLETQVQVLGSSHPQTLRTRHNYASASLSSNPDTNYEEILELYKTVYDTRKKVLGPVHPETLSTLHNIGLVLTAMGDLDSALNMYQQVYESRRDILGPQNSNTLRTSHNMALVLKKQGKYEQALELLQEVHETRKALLGETHPDTLNSSKKIKGVKRLLESQEK